MRTKREDFILSNSVKIGPNQHLEITVPIGKSPSGVRSEHLYTISYSDLLSLLEQKKASRKSKNPGSKLSRCVALYVSAVDKGKWNSGAEIDVAFVLDKLLVSLETEKTETLRLLTRKAKQSLRALSKNKNFEPLFQKRLEAQLKRLNGSNPL